MLNMGFSTSRSLFRRGTSKLKAIGPIVMLRKYAWNQPIKKSGNTGKNRTIFKGVEVIKGYSED